MPLKNNSNGILSLFLIICLVGLPQISETIYTPSLPDIAHSLSTSSQLVEWTLSIYFIGFALGVGVWGQWSDHIGRRKAMLLGLFIYVFASLACALSPSINWLLAGRLIQAFGISVGSVITMTMMRDKFSGVERAKIFSTVMMALSLAPALGPLIGGYVTQWFHWKANFIVLTNLGLALFIYSYFRLPETHPNLGINKNQYSIIEITKKLLFDKKVLACTFLVAGFNGILFSYYAEAPFLIINLLNFTPSQYGLLGIFIGLISVIGAFISRQLNSYFQQENIILVGCLVTFLSCMILVFNVFAGLVSVNHPFLALLGLFLPILGFFLGFGLAIPNILSIALSEYQSVIGTAGSIFGLMYYVLTAIFLFWMGLIHNGSFIPMPIYFIALATLMLVTSITTFKSKN